MSNRLRPIRCTVTFTADEYALLRAQMAQAEALIFSNFAREMLLTGQVKHYDFRELKALTREFSRMAGSINQIAKRCNETRNLYEPDVVQLRREYMAVKALVQEQLVKLLRRL